MTPLPCQTEGLIVVPGRGCRWVIRSWIGSKRWIQDVRAESLARSRFERSHRADRFTRQRYRWTTEGTVLGRHVHPTGKPKVRRTGPNHR